METSSWEKERPFSARDTFWPFCSLVPARFLGLGGVAGRVGADGDGGADERAAADGRPAADGCDGADGRTAADGCDGADGRTGWLACEPHPAPERTGCARELVGKSLLPVPGRDVCIDFSSLWGLRTFLPMDDASSPSLMGGFRFIGIFITAFPSIFLIF